MKLVKDGYRAVSTDSYAGKVRVHSSLCYDFIVSPRALFNRRIFTRTRRWAVAAQDELDETLKTRGRFFFQGFDTALGYGAAQLIEQLPPAAGPADLFPVIRATDPRTFALHMLDTGETSAERLERYYEILHTGSTNLEDALAGLAPGWAHRCQRVLTEPATVQEELVEFLEAYLERVYASRIEPIRQALDQAVPAAERLLGVMPTVDAIEQLSGGYTIATDLDLRSITLAPSIFIYPFMSTRVDERTGKALVVYGVPSDIFESYDPVAIQPGLAEALKALSDPNRLTILGLLAQQTMSSAELVGALRLSQPTVHYHLAQLRAAGLIRQQREKGMMSYSMRHSAAAGFLNALEALILGASSRVAEDSKRRKRGCD